MFSLPEDTCELPTPYEAKTQQHQSSAYIWYWLLHSTLQSNTAKVHLFMDHWQIELAKRVSMSTASGLLDTKNLTIESSTGLKLATWIHLRLASLSSQGWSQKPSSHGHQKTRMSRWHELDWYTTYTVCSFTHGSTTAKAQKFVTRVNRWHRLDWSELEFWILKFKRTFQTVTCRKDKA